MVPHSPPFPIACIRRRPPTADDSLATCGQSRKRWKKAGNVIWNFLVGIRKMPSWAGQRSERPVCCVILNNNFCKRCIIKNEYHIWATWILKLSTVCRMRTTPVIFNPPHGLAPPVLTRVSQSFGLQTQSICNVPGKKYLFRVVCHGGGGGRGRPVRRMAIKLWAIFQICRGRPSAAWAWRGAWRSLNVVAFQVDNITVSVNHMRILQVLRQVNALWPDLGDPTQATRYEENFDSQAGNHWRPLRRRAC